MFGVIALHSLMTSSEIIVNLSYDFVDGLMRSVLTKRPETIVADRADTGSREIIYESSHPVSSTQIYFTTNDFNFYSMKIIWILISLW
jgi:hypothetical protein